MYYRNILLISGFIICTLMFTIVGLGSEPEWQSLAEQEKFSILTDITESLEKLKSIGVTFDWMDGERKKDGTDDITGEYHYFEVFDDSRNYAKQSKEELFVQSELAATPGSSGFEHISERSWNGSLMRILDHGSKTGSVRGKVPYFKAAEVMLFSIIGRDHSGQSWVKRYQNSGDMKINYDVVIDAENNNLIKVTEQPKNLTSVYPRQTFIFDRTKDFAITRCYLENVYQDENRVHRLSDIRFEKFKQVDGFYIPFKISRIAKSSRFDFTGVQYITVKDVTVNENSHEKFLNSFTFPSNTRLYDYILDMPIHVGVDSEELEDILQEGLELAKKEIDKEVVEPIEQTPQSDTEKELTENLIQSNFNDNEDNPITAESKENGVTISNLIAIGVILVLSVIIGIALKKRLKGHSAVIIICCSLFLSPSTFAKKTINYQLYKPELFNDLSPEHRAIHERDLTRLCGINCLYQVYLWINGQPTYSHRDIMKMVQYIDGVTIEELLDCANKLGLEAQAKMVNYKYLLESANSCKIALVTAPDKKAHFITFLGTEDKTSTYYIDYPRGQRHISGENMVSRLKRYGGDPENIPIVEFPYPLTVEKKQNGIVFEPSHIKIRDEKPWLLGKQGLKFESSLLNNSSKRIKILKIQESCRCTAFKLEKELLEPGEKVRAEGKLTVKPGSPATIQILVLDDSNNSAILKIDVDSELPFEVFKKNLSFGALSANDSKTLFYDVLVKSAYPLHLKNAYIRGKAKDSYVIDASFSSKMNVVWGDKATPYTKYTIICDIETSNCSPLRTVHDLVLSFVDDEEYTFDHVVPIRFEILKTATR